VEAIIYESHARQQFFRWQRRVLTRAVWPVTLALIPLCSAAHDIPNDVTVQILMKPDPQRLNLMVRVPMRSIRDVVFPEKGPGYLDLDRTPPLLPDLATLWIGDFIGLYEDDRRLPDRPKVAAARVALQSDRSFASYEEARTHFAAPPLSGSTNVAWTQTMLDMWFEYPIRSERSRFSIQPALGRLGVHVVTVLRFLPPGGGIRAFEFTSDPGLVRLDPRWHQAAARFVDLGFHHILEGTDHLLFLLCLVIPFRRFRALVPVVTSFTAAHSITLIASAYHFAPDALWFPPLVETLIAVSIVYMALENIVGGKLVRRRWAISFGFGLVHGFGFSFALRQTLQFAGSHLLASLLSFNLGVELGQLLVLALLIPALELLFRLVVAERMGTVILSALVAHTGWHWMLERGDRLMQYRVQWPEWNVALLVSAMRWSMALLVIAGLIWAVRSLSRRRTTDQARAAARDR
jgi:hypothetical protein